MAKGPSESAAEELDARRPPVNTDAPWPTLVEAKARVLGIPAKLHQWATDSPNRRFDDPHNLVADPAFLMVGWDRVRGNRGARTAGVDGVAPRAISPSRRRFSVGCERSSKPAPSAPFPCGNG
jgi:RNA-directed DNA polymerase